MILHRILYFLPVPLLVLAGAFSPCTAGPGDDARKAALDAFLGRVQLESGVPGVSAAVSMNGHIVYSGGAGLADVQNAVPQSRKTVHNIGSISKVIAVVGVLRLVEQGKVALDAPVERYVPYFPEKFDVAGKKRQEKPHRITVRHILTHSSGIRHYRDGEFGEHEALRKVQYEKFEEAIAFWKDDPLLFVPEEYWSYSSHASNLMHGIVESVTGVGFEEYLRLHVWHPAGMLSTQFDVPSRIIERRGRSYSRDARGKLIHAPDENVSYKYAGGGMLSTVEDLCRFAAAINSGRLLEPETVKLMWTNHFPGGIDSWQKRNKKDPWERRISFNQCLVWREQVDGGGNVSYSHGGSVRGTVTYLVTYPALRLVIAAHGNSKDMPLADTVNGIARFFLPPSFKPPIVTGKFPDDE